MTNNIFPFNGKRYVLCGAQRKKSGSSPGLTSSEPGILKPKTASGEEVKLPSTGVVEPVRPSGPTGVRAKLDEPLDGDQIIASKASQVVKELSPEAEASLDKVIAYYTTGGAGVSFLKFLQQSDSHFYLVNAVYKRLVADYPHLTDEAILAHLLAAVKRNNRVRNNINQTYAAIQNVLAQRYNLLRQARGRKATAGESGDIRALEEGHVYNVGRIPMMLSAGKLVPVEEME